jgi:hypothetical protein
VADKVIHEIRIIETDDGFRIEIKGDKERLKEMGFGPGMFFGGQRHGPGHGHWGPGRGFGSGFFWRGFGFGPWGQRSPEYGEEPPAKA